MSIKEAVGKKVVRGVIDRWISQEIDWKSLKKLGLLGIDEIALRKGYQDYLTLVTGRIDDQVRLIGVIEGREKASSHPKTEHKKTNLPLGLKNIDPSGRFPGY